MTSEASEHLPNRKGCFVYMTLPGRTDQVVAGRFQIDQTEAGPVGRFVYGKSYLGNPDAVAVDPVELNAVSGRAFSHAGDDGMFLAFRDASPDFWGRYVIDRALGGQGDEITYLLMGPDDRAGALGFGTGQTPPAPQRYFNQRFQLEELQAMADDLLANRPIDDDAKARQAQQLLKQVTSMGGARPKAVVEDDGALWLAKFRRQDDAYDMPILEHSMLELARECGISVASSKVAKIGDGHVILAKRFDRERVDDGYLRHRMVSALTVLGGTERDRSRWSYLLFADQIRRLSDGYRSELHDLFRRVTLNMLVNNDDDHPRNHALLAKGRIWRLSPAYDIAPRPQVSHDRHLAMSLGNGSREATKDNLLGSVERFAISREEAEKTVADIAAIVENRWHAICRKNGMTEADCQAISSAFMNPGFDWANSPSP